MLYRHSHYFLGVSQEVDQVIETYKVGHAQLHAEVLLRLKVVDECYC